MKLKPYNFSFVFDGDMTLSNFDATSDNLLCNDSVNRDDVVSKLIQFTSLHRAYLLVKFDDELKVSHFE